MSSGAPIRVLIVDDSALVRKMLAAALENDKQIEVVGTAPDPYVARDKIMALNPDVITLDIEMPRMDGITFLKKLMQYKPLPVIVISSLAQASCQSSIEALRAGAVDVLAKPNGPYSVGELGLSLAAKIHTAFAARHSIGARRGAPSASPEKPAVPVARPPLPYLNTNKVIAIGASTGGPPAVAEVLQSLPRNVPPILLVQHMPAVFTKHFAERLNRDCEIEVKEAEDGDELLAGRALIAPGNFHMTLKRSATGARHVSISSGPPVCFSRPSVDVMFCSVAGVVGKDTIGVLLTGMGSDGARGLLELRNRGAVTIAQTEETCVVYGMPKEAVRMGAVQRSLNLDRIAAAILTELSTPLATLHSSKTA